MSRRRVALAALALSVALSAGVAWVGTCAELRDAALESLAAEQGRLDSVTRALEAQVARAEALSVLTADDVADPTTIETLHARLDDARLALGASDGGDDAGTSVFDYASLESAATSVSRSSDEARDAARSLSQACAAVRASHAELELSEARDSLTAAVGDAEATLEATRGRVADSSTTEALAAAVESARSALDDGAGDVTVATLTELRADLAEAGEACTSSNEAWQAAQAAAAARAASSGSQGSTSGGGGATSSGSPSSTPSSSGGGSSWAPTVSGSGYVDDGGGLTEYFPGYYVAHRSTGTMGQMIASRPATVTIGGRTYRYVSERLCEIGSPYSAIQGWATANGGIALQTCDYSTGRKMALVLHYEPV